MYDFANTMFAMNVISLYFALWVTVDKQGSDILYGWVLSISMLIAALFAPVIGAMSDKIGKKKPFLILFTIVCCVFTALIGIAHTVVWGLLFFAIANFAYQIADVLYNALLPEVSSAKQRGRVSGYGVSLGYCGTIAGLLLIGPFVLKFGRQAAFIPTAFFFLLFALPCFFFVKEKTRSVKKADLAKKTSNRFSLLPFKTAFIKTKTTITRVKQYPDLLVFLIAVFIAFNAIDTVMVFMSVYTKKIALFNDKQLIVFYIISSVFAMGGSFFTGFITDKLGPKKTLSAVFLLWCVTILLALISFHTSMFWIIGPLAGISLGATWTSARPFVIKLSPPSMIGEVFGFYGFIGKSASIIGPLIWGSVTWAFGFLGLFKYRIAIFTLLIFLVIGLILLQKVKVNPNTT